MGSSGLLIFAGARAVLGAAAVMALLRYFNQSHKATGGSRALLAGKHQSSVGSLGRKQIRLASVRWQKQASLFCFDHAIQPKCRQMSGFGKA